MERSSNQIILVKYIVTVSLVGCMALVSIVIHRFIIDFIYILVLLDIIGDVLRLSAFDAILIELVIVIKIRGIIY